MHHRKKNAFHFNAKALVNRVWTSCHLQALFLHSSIGLYFRVCFASKGFTHKNANNKLRSAFQQPEQVGVKPWPTPTLLDRLNLGVQSCHALHHEPLFVLSGFWTRQICTATFKCIINKHSILLPATSLNFQCSTNVAYTNFNSCWVLNAKIPLAGLVGGHSGAVKQGRPRRDANRSVRTSNNGPSYSPRVRRQHAWMSPQQRKQAKLYSNRMQEHNHFLTSSVSAIYYRDKECCFSCCWQVDRRFLVSVHPFHARQFQEIPNARHVLAINRKLAHNACRSEQGSAELCSWARHVQEKMNSKQQMTQTKDFKICVSECPLN